MVMMLVDVDHIMVYANARQKGYKINCAGVEEYIVLI